MEELGGNDTRPSFSNDAWSMEELRARNTFALLDYAPPERHMSQDASQIRTTMTEPGRMAIRHPATQASKRFHTQTMAMTTPWA